MSELNPHERYGHLTDTQIRRALDAQYRAGAVNEMLVAGLRYEMSTRQHRHRWIGGHRFTGRKVAVYGSRECRYCYHGTDEYLMSWDQIAAKVREADAATDELIAKVLRA